MDKKERIILFVPLIITILAILIINITLIKSNEIIINNFEIISNNYINFVSILVGFLITTISIIIGFFDKKIIKIIVRNKKDKILYANWFLTIMTGIASIIQMFYIAAVFNEDIKIVYKIPLYIFILFMLLFMLYLIFSLIYFFGIAKSVMTEEIEDEKENEEVEKMKREKISMPEKVK